MAKNARQRSIGFKRHCRTSEVQGKKMAGLKVKYIGESSHFELTKGKVYEVLSVEKDWYRIADDTGEDYLYPPQLFVVLS